MVDVNLTADTINTIELVDLIKTLEHKSDNVTFEKIVVLLDANIKICNANYLAAIDSAIEDCSDLDPFELRQRVMDIEGYAFINTESLRLLIIRLADAIDNFVSMKYVKMVLRQTGSNFCENSAMTALLLAVSDRFDEYRESKKTDEEKAKAKGNGIATTSFQRTSIKFWVRSHDTVKIICDILEHLPVFSFKKPREFGQQISSIYYDDDDLNLYDRRLVKDENAELFRIRWYGQLLENSKLFIERKTHHELWVAMPSVKERFVLPQPLCCDYMSGNVTIDDEYAALNNVKLSTEDFALAGEIQKSYVDKQLQPKVLISYTRAAFQTPDTDEVRISLDYDLLMTRQKGVDTAKEWKSDPSRVTEDDIHLFPFIIIEVKLHSHIVNNPPAFISKLMEKKEMIRVDKFSKFCHSCAILFPNKVKKLPYWFNFKNFENQELALELFARNKHSAFMTDAQTLAKDQKTAIMVPLKEFDTSRLKSSKERVQKADADANADANTNANEPATSSDAPELATSSGSQKPAEESNDPRMKSLHAGKNNDHRDIFGRSLPVKLAKKLQKNINRTHDREKFEGVEIQADADEDIEMRTLRDIIRFQKKQKMTACDYIIATIMCDPHFREAYTTKLEKRRKIEPKTYFANERTYLQWFSASVLLAAIGIAMSDVKQCGRRDYRQIGMFWCISSSICIIYALVYYRWRLHKLMNRHAVSSFSGIWGPTILSIFFFFAIATGGWMAYYNSKIPCTESTPLPLYSFVSDAYKLSYHAYVPTGLEMSSVAIHPKTKELYVVGDWGAIVTLDLDSRIVKSTWNMIRADFEAITFVNYPGAGTKFDDFMYLGLEESSTSPHSPYIYEVRISTRTIERKFRLLGFPADSAHGMEAMEFVPIANLDPTTANDNSVIKGYFYCGSQLDGQVYVYEIALWDVLDPNPTVRLEMNFKPLPVSVVGHTDISDITYFQFLRNDGVTIAKTDMRTIGMNSTAIAVLPNMHYYIALSMPSANAVSFHAIDPSSGLPDTTYSPNAKVAEIMFPIGLKDVEGIVVWCSSVGECSCILASDTGDSLQRYNVVIPIPGNPIPGISPGRFERIDTVQTVTTRRVI